MESGFKLNAEAPEFVPLSLAPVSVAGLYHPWYGFLPADWLHLEPLRVYPDPAHDASADALHRIVKQVSKSPITIIIIIIIIILIIVVVIETVICCLRKQVECQLSDGNLSPNEALAKIMNKDPASYGGLFFVCILVGILFFSSFSRCRSSAVCPDVAEEGQVLGQRPAEARLCSPLLV